MAPRKDGGTRVHRPARAGDVRRGNLAALLRQVHVRGATSRSELTAALGLNRSTIGGLTAELVEAGLVREERAEPGRRSTGRPSHLVAPQAERVQVLAVDLRVTQVTAARIGLGGVVLDRRSTRTGLPPWTPEAAVRTVDALVRGLLADPAGEHTCLGVGVSVPGLVRSSDGLVRQGPNLGWREVPLGTLLAERVGLPVSVGNDADLGGLAEHTRGVAVGHEDVVFLAGHSGIGAGILTGGRPLRGLHGYAGEVGHVVVNPQGRECHCGSRGCWETEIGEERLLELAGRPVAGGFEAAREVASAAAGEARARDAVEEVAGWLGLGLANVVNAFNPEMVVMGGALGEIFRVAGESVRAHVTRGALAPSRDELHIVLPDLGDDSSLLGAAELAFAALLEDPVRVIAQAQPDRAGAAYDLAAVRG